eukprot:TRINITY_DN10228_c0_g1_i1.p1 TRINITY_DN10228_c0_g1~~TRINITY_DN10228_c0_g1_i1.p1  ORF type:complete len:449 (-),score=19.70 TRINITY_DN10228_c0_g1_i1:36-1382(-)
MSKSTYLILTVFLIAAHVDVTSAILKIYLPDGSTEEHPIGYYLVSDLAFMPRNVTLVLYTGSTTFWKTNFANNIGFLIPYKISGQFFREYSAINITASIVLIEQETGRVEAGLGAIFNNDLIMGEPVLEITRQTIDRISLLLQKDSELGAYCDSLEIRTWNTFITLEAKLGFQIGLTAIMLVSLVFATRKLILYIKFEKKFTLKIATACLLLETISSLLRFLYIAIDPIYFYYRVPPLITQLGFTFTWPVEIITTMLIALYWQELITSSKLKVTSFINTLKIPFIITSVILIIMEFILAYLRYLNEGGNHSITVFVILSSILYAIVLLLVSIHFVYFGIKILRMLKTGDSNTYSRKKQLMETTIFIELMALFHLLWLCTLLLIPVKSIFYTPKGWYFIWFLMFFYLGVISLLKTLVFHPPSIVHSSASSKFQKLSKVKQDKYINSNAM